MKRRVETRNIIKSTALSLLTIIAFTAVVSAKPPSRDIDKPLIDRIRDDYAPECIAEQGVADESDVNTGQLYLCLERKVLEDAERKLAREQIGRLYNQ